MATSRVALRPYNEAPRCAWQGERGTANFINDDGDTDSITTARIQFLAARYGLIGSYAVLLASLAFGGRHG